MPIMSIILASMLLFALPAFAEQSEKGFYDKKAEGWFWYKQEPLLPEPLPLEQPSLLEAKLKPIEQPSITTPPPPLQSPSPLPPLSVEWFQQNLNTYKNRAIDFPTKENVEAYLYLQRVMMDKSEKFARVMQVAAISDPALDENNRRPQSYFGQSVADEQAKTNRDDLFKKLANIAGLWFFYSSECAYCAKQAPVLKQIQQQYGLEILPISLDGLPIPGNIFPDFVVDNGQAKQFQVIRTPTLILAKPPNSFIRISEGILSEKAIIDRSLMLATDQNWLPEKEYNDTKIVKQDFIEATNVPENIAENPTALVDYLRAKVKR